MNTAEAIEFLESQGYKSFSINSSQSNEAVVFAGSKLLTENVAQCETNERVYFHIYVHDMGEIYKQIPTIELEIVGERKGIWFKLEAYSLRLQDLVSNLSISEQMLRRAWNALT